MMKLWKKIFFLLFLGFIYSPLSFAQTGGGAGASKTAVKTGRYEAYMSAGYLGFGSGASQYDIAPGFQLIPFTGVSWLQAGGEITYQKISYRGGSTSNMMLMAGITGNWGTTINDAFFVSLGMGLKSGSTDVPDAASDDPNGMGVYLVTGKRFPIAGAFTIRPTIGMFSGGATQLVFRPFAVSYHF